MKIKLTIAYVGFGGNIANGEYFFCYDNDVIFVTDKDTSIEFIFSEATTNDFSMKALLSTDSADQITKIIKSSDNRSYSLMHRNTKAQMTFTTILVEDKKRGKLISCDPQVLNSPQN